MKETFAKYEKELLRNFLVLNAGSIAQFIKNNGEFSTSFLNDKYELGIFPTILSFHVKRVSEIDSVTRGSLPKGVTRGTVKISFEATTEIDVTASEYVKPPEKRFRHGEQIGSINFLVKALESPQESEVKTREVVNKIVKKKIPVQATVTLDRREFTEAPFYTDQYSDLSIDSIVIEGVSYTA